MAATAWEVSTGSTGATRLQSGAEEPQIRETLQPFEHRQSCEFHTSTRHAASGWPFKPRFASFVRQHELRKGVQCGARGRRRGPAAGGRGAGAAHVPTAAGGSGRAAGGGGLGDGAPGAQAQGCDVQLLWEEYQQREPQGYRYL